MKRPIWRVRDDAITKGANLTLRESLLPLSLVTILFFLWGFAYGLLDVLNKHFQVTLNVTRAQSSGLQAAYFGAYPVASMTFAQYTMRKAGYKATFMLGLTLYGIGALLFWPAAIKRSFGGFCGATFVIGSGLGSLETAANPYLAICGPPKYSEMRINIAQSFQAVGTVVGPLLASRVFFKSEDPKSLASVQWVYLGIAVFVFLLAIVFFFADIPEITDMDMQEQMNVSVSGEARKVVPLRKQYTLWWAVIAEGCYCGAQVALATYFINYALEIKPGLKSHMAANYLAIAQGCFAIGRFTGSGLMKVIKPRIVFMMYYTGVVSCLAVAIATKNNVGIAFISLTFFFESICFPTIFALGLRGLGRNTKRGASYIIASIIGGAIVPPIVGATADAFDNTGRAFFVALIFFLISGSFAAGVNFHPRTRHVVDDFHESKVGVVDSETRDLEVVAGKGGVVDHLEDKEGKD
ncbi:major facilitator superfamily domain-containing protein [Cadophora sp. MPI-SDFR-AT-0126]|nr:major facilitator superfamily domain-containing protein [Leotiomycetes sp. MPI-SDFR-AT-0126]